MALDSSLDNLSLTRLRSVIDVRTEWRTFSNDKSTGQDPSRVGGPLVRLACTHIVTAARPPRSPMTESTQERARHGDKLLHAAWLFASCLVSYSLIRAAEQSASRGRIQVAGGEINRTARHACRQQRRA